MIFHHQHRNLVEAKKKDIKLKKTNKVQLSSLNFPVISERTCSTNDRYEVYVESIN